MTRVEFKIIDQKKNEYENVLEKPKDNENVSFIKDTYLLYNRIDPNKRFENFISGKSNQLALQASLKVSGIFLVYFTVRDLYFLEESKL